MKKEELGNVGIALLVMTFVIGFSEFTILSFIYGLLMAIILLSVFILTQKIVADQLGLDIKFKLWTFRRYWLRWQDKLSWDFPAWIVLPLIMVVLSDGLLIWTAILTFGSRTLTKKATKR